MTTRVYDQYLDPFAHDFIDALCLVGARVPLAEWVWRHTRMTGTLVMAITDINAGNRLIALSNGQANAARREELGKHLLRFMCAALRA